MGQCPKRPSLLDDLNLPPTAFHTDDFQQRAMAPIHAIYGCLLFTLPFCA